MFKKLARHIVGGLATGIFALGIMALVTAPILAQQPLGQRSFTQRLFPTQQTHYLRFTFNFNSCVITPTTGTVCALKVGSLPYNSYLTQINLDLITVFNPAGGTATIGLSTAATGATILAAQNVFTGATLGAAPYVFCGTTCGAGTFAGIGLAVTGNTAAQTGTLGGFDVYVVFTVTANAAPQGTTGQLIGIIQYVAPNDGTCTQVPLGATAGAC